MFVQKVCRPTARGQNPCHAFGHRRKLIKKHHVGGAPGNNFQQSQIPLEKRLGILSKTERLCPRMRIFRQSHHKKRKAIAGLIACRQNLSGKIANDAPREGFGLLKPEFTQFFRKLFAGRLVAEAPTDRPTATFQGRFLRLENRIEDPGNKRADALKAISKLKSRQPEHRPDTFVGNRVIGKNMGLLIVYVL